MLGAGAFDPLTEVLVNKALTLPESGKPPGYGIVQFESAATLDAEALRRLGLSLLRDSTSRASCAWAVFRRLVSGTSCRRDRRQ